MEKYKPPEAEFKKAENMMTSTEKGMSEKREKEIKAERLTKLLENVSNLRLNIEKINKNNLKPKLQWPGETRICNCGLGKEYCRGEQIPQPEILVEEDGTILIKTHIEYRRYYTDSQRIDKDADLSEVFVLKSNEVIYEREEGSFDGTDTRNHQQFLFKRDGGNLQKGKQTSFLHYEGFSHNKRAKFNVEDGMNAIDMEDAEEYVYEVIDKLNNQIQDEIEKIKKSLK